MCTTLLFMDLSFCVYLFIAEWFLRATYDNHGAAIGSLMHLRSQSERPNAQPGIPVSFFLLSASGYKFWFISCFCDQIIFVPVSSSPHYTVKAVSQSANQYLSKMRFLFLFLAKKANKSQQNHSKEKISLSCFLVTSFYVAKACGKKKENIRKKKKSHTHTCYQSPAAASLLWLSNSPKTPKIDWSLHAAMFHNM